MNAKSQKLLLDKKAQVAISLPENGCNMNIVIMFQKNVWDLLDSVINGNLH